MNGHKITGVSIDVKDINLIINLFDCIPCEDDKNEPTPFNSFSILQDSFIDLIGLLVNTGLTIQKDTGICLNLPQPDDIEEVENND